MGDNSVLLLGTTIVVKKINFLTYQDVQIFVFIRLFKGTCCVIVGKIESLRYRNADAMKNAMVEEGLGGAYGVRGGKIKLRICFECQRQRELFS